MWQLMIPLQGDWQEWIRICGRGQRFIVQAHNPQVIETQPRRFQQAHDLDWRAFILHLKRRCCG